MRIEQERKLFVGLRIDNKTREQLATCAPRDKHFVDGTNPDYLTQLRGTEDAYIGKIIEPGAPAMGMEDLKRNIMSILNRVAPGRHREDSIKIFAIDDGEPPPLPRKAGDRDDEVDPEKPEPAPPARYRDYY